MVNWWLIRAPDKAKIGPKTGLLVFLTTTMCLECFVCGLFWVYSSISIFWYQNQVSLTLRWDFTQENRPQNLVTIWGRRRFLAFLTTTICVNCLICGCMLFYSLRRFFWYQNYGPRTLRSISGGFQTSPASNLGAIAQKSWNLTVFGHFWWLKGK